MSEKVFNFFVYFENSVARELGVWFHKCSGTDAAKTDFLRSQVISDHSKARRFDLPRSFTPEEWRARLRIDGALPILDPILTELNVPKSSFVYCLTPILNGIPYWDQMIGPGAFLGNDVTDFGRDGHMPDYLVEYTDGQHFHLDRLIDDDFFSAIRILFQNKHYVSASKLLMCCIDTLAFVEFGDTRGNFANWIERYCDLSSLGVTAGELWEFRNAVLHMTSLDSKKVIAGKVGRIVPYVALRGSVPPQNSDHAKPFNLLQLIDAVAAGIGRWGDSYNDAPDKNLDFISRYDMTISDKRIATIIRPADSQY